MVFLGVELFFFAAVHFPFGFDCTVPFPRIRAFGTARDIAPRPAGRGVSAACLAARLKSALGDRIGVAIGEDFSW